MDSDSKKCKSRRAAQSRRSHENSEFTCLAETLPLSPAILSQLDKATIIRISLSYLKLNAFTDSAFYSSSAQQAEQFPMLQALDGSKLLDSFDGFAFCLGSELQLMYISETVSIALGLSQIELLGTYFLDYVHQNEQPTIMELLNRCLQGDIPNIRFCVRLKSNLTRRVTKDCVDDCVGFKVVECTVSAKTEGSVGIHCIGVVLPTTCMQELALDNTVFVLTCDARLYIHYCDSNAEGFLGFHSAMTTLREISVYKLIHPNSLEQFVSFHQGVLELGACSSEYLHMQALNSMEPHLVVHCLGLRVQRNKANNATMLTLIITVVSDCISAC